MRETKKTDVSIVVVRLGLLALALTHHAVAQEPPATPPTAPSIIKLNVEVGGQTTILDSSERWTKFVQWRDVPRNFTLTGLDFAVERDGSPWSFTGLAVDAGQLDARYRLRLEKFGKWRTEFRYSSSPNFISRLVQAPYAETAPGVLTIPDAIRSALQAAVALPAGNPGDPGVRETAAPALVNDLIGSTGFRDLRVRRERFWLGQEVKINEHWLAYVNFTHDRRGGYLPMGMGTYERFQTPQGPPFNVPTNQGGVFNVYSNEVPEHIAYRTYEVRTGIALHGKRGLVRLEYTGSLFSNQIPALRWTNPFALSDQQANPPAGGVGRWRFGNGQTSLPPDNRAHTFSILARVNLPGQSFASALVAFGFRRQDERLLPITLNTAITAPVCPATPPQPEGCLPAGVTPTDVAALPRPNLDGNIHTLTSDFVVGTRRWKSLLLTGRYRNYNYDNLTPQFPLPGYAAFGESFWRTNITAIPPAANIPLTDFQEINAFFRQQASLEAVWKPNQKFQFKIEPNWEAWNRQHRQVARTNDWGAITQVIYEPVKWFNSRVRYRYADRVPQAYDPGVIEFSQLRRFDQDHRVLHDAGIVVNFANKGPWVLTANYNYTSNAYDSSFYGLSRNLRGVAGAELNYAPSDLWGLVFYYNHDRARYNYRQIAKSGGTSEAAIWNPLSEWDRNTRDVVDSLGLGFNLSGLQQKWSLNANYDFSSARQKYTTFNPDPASIPAAMTLDATAHPWPDTEATFGEIRLDSSYRVRPNMEIGARYLFQPYRLDDFAWDVMQPYMFGLASAPDNNAFGSLHLNSRYGDSNAHMVGLYVRYTF